MLFQSLYKNRTDEETRLCGRLAVISDACQAGFKESANSAFCDMHCQADIVRQMQRSASLHGTVLQMCILSAPDAAMHYLPNLDPDIFCDADLLVAYMKRTARLRPKSEAKENSADEETPLFFAGQRLVKRDITITGKRGIDGIHLLL